MSSFLLEYSSEYLPRTRKGVMNRYVSVNIVTASIVRSAKHRYLSNAEADFGVFRPTGATRCTDGGEIVNRSL